MIKKSVAKLFKLAEAALPEPPSLLNRFIKLKKVYLNSCLKKLKFRWMKKDKLSPGRGSLALFSGVILIIFARVSTNYRGQRLNSTIPSFLATLLEVF
jgi:hypothetical protein